MFLPPRTTEFICSRASWAASGTSYSTKAKPCRDRTDQGTREGTRENQTENQRGNPEVLWLPLVLSDLVLHGDRVPGHVDAFDWSKGDEGLPDGFLAQLVVDGAHVDPAHDGQSSLALRCYLVDRRSRGSRSASTLMEALVVCPPPGSHLSRHSERFPCFTQK